MDRRLLDAVKTAIDPDQTGDIRQEVTATIKEIAFTVHQITTTTTLSWTYDLCYVNVVTKENNTYCIEVSISGWRVRVNYYTTRILVEILRHYFQLARYRQYRLQSKHTLISVYCIYLYVPAEKARYIHQSLSNRIYTQI